MSLVLPDRDSVSREPLRGGPAAAEATPCIGSDACASICATCRVRLFAVCAALGETEIGDLERIVDEAALPARTSLFMAGDAARAVYTVTSGALRLQRDLADGRRQVIGFAAPGDFIGLALDETYTFSADALTQVTLCAFPRERFIALTTQKPALLVNLHQAASHELTIAQQHMVLLGRRRAEERVAAFLMGWRDRLQRVSGKSATIALPMGRQDIADHLGLTIETVSRIFARLMRDKILLDVPNGVRVLDEARLRALAPD
jgi:CRP/FNR family transcriptional regulator, anaerobic regulatory protein